MQAYIEDLERKMATATTEAEIFGRSKRSIKRSPTNVLASSQAGTASSERLAEKKEAEVVPISAHAPARPQLSSGAAFNPFARRSGLMRTPPVRSAAQPAPVEQVSVQCFCRVCGAYAYDV